MTRERYILLRWVIGLPLVVLASAAVTTLFIGRREWHPAVAEFQDYIYGNAETYKDGLFDEVEIRRDEHGWVIKKENKTRKWVWLWTYDLKGRLTAEVRPDASSRAWEYDDAGRFSHYRGVTGTVCSIEYAEDGTIRSRITDRPGMSGSQGNTTERVVTPQELERIMPPQL